MIPDYCEAITAYRCWDVFPNGVLCGQAVQEPWPMYQSMVARCATMLVYGHDGKSAYDAHIKDGQWLDAPVFRCDCGIHAYLTFTEAEQRITNDPNAGYYTSNRPNGRAWGALKLWGKLVEHESGYRAQFAYPSALWCEDAGLAAKIAALYGVPCEVKALPRPKPKDCEDSLSYWYTSAFKPLKAHTQLSSYWISSWTPPSPSPIVPSVIQPATLAQVKALGSSRHQKKSAAIAAAQKEEAAARKRDLIQQYLAMGAQKIDVEVEA